MEILIVATRESARSVLTMVAEGMGCDEIIVVTHERAAEATVLRRPTRILFNYDEEYLRVRAGQKPAWDDVKIMASAGSIVLRCGFMRLDVEDYIRLPESAEYFRRRFSLESSS